MEQGTKADEAIAVGRKVKAPHPSTIAHRQNVQRRAPPLPPKPSSSSHPAIGAKRNAGTSSTLPLKTLQGVRTRRTDSTKDGWERDVVFVTRNAPLGALMGRCRSLIMEEGYTRIRLHALAAAIPHALLLLHALLDILPYPQGDRGMWYEIRTGSTECIDEFRPGSSIHEKESEKGKGRGKGKEKEKDQEGDIQMVEDELDLSNIGGVEEDAPERHARLKSSVEIDLHIGPKRFRTATDAVTADGQQQTKQKGKQSGAPTLSKRNRPSKRKRELARRDRATRKDGQEEGEAEDEEDMMNQMNGGAGGPSSLGRGARSSDATTSAQGQKRQRSRARPKEQPGEEEEEEELENR